MRSLKIQVNVILFKSTLSNFGLKRHDEVNISRQRLGHSKLTHLYLLNGDEQPGCIFCDCQLTFCTVPTRFLFERSTKLHDKLMCIKSYRFCNHVIFTKKFKLFNILDVYTSSYLSYYIIFLCTSDRTLYGVPCQ